MHREPHLRIVRVSEDADEDGELRLADPGEWGGEAPEAEPNLIELRYSDQHPWRCDCGCANNADWADCVWCGRDRGDCEA